MLLQRFALRNIAAARTRSRLASLLLLKRRPRRLNLATSPTEARVGAARAATALRWSCGVSLKQDKDQDQTPKASATKAAGYFLLSKATKVRLDSLRSKVTKEVAFVLNHRPARSMHPQGFFMRDIPVPIKNGAHPCAPPSGSSIAFASARRRTATAIVTAKAKAKAQAKVDAMISVLKQRPNWRAVTAPD